MFLRRHSHQDKAERAAATCYAQNMENNTFCRLPAEMILDISDFLQGADLLAYNSACRRVTAVLRCTTKLAKMSKKSKEAFTKRLRLDTFYRDAIVEEEQATGILESLLCSYCQEHHPRDGFAVTELGKPCNERVCRGATRVLRVCKHRRMTWKELKGLGMNASSSEASRELFVCASNGRHQMVQRNAEVVRLYGTRFDPSESNVRGTLHFRVLPLSMWSHRVYCSDIQRALVELDEYICPHLRTSSGLVCLCNRTCLGLLSSNPSPLSSRDGGDVFVEAFRSAIATSSCSVRDCHSKITIYREWAQTEIGVQITQDVGPMDSPLDPSWLAATEEALSKDGAITPSMPKSHSSGPWSYWEW
ncbi:hypothetical protein K504DRAFT_502689 [Pleomassaria siparia CBS 279.74]|uniref:F-box domain-containing protein n=1 Tax=Pleomassaria siparia CBS 279.74 TaxID=1314801 RepID=A0A6G1K770_9PLEO|nr:hypothetical protein K504DRAFT_502689 [Pleomassaria siparia CBS 279.74]